MSVAIATETTTKRRPLDAYYTPDALAEACVRWLVRDGFCRHGATRTLEPSVGKGAFVRATRKTFGGGLIYAVDMDPSAIVAANLSGANFTFVTDFLARTFGMFDLIIGNPPFNQAEAHVRHALGHRSEWGSVAFLLRLAFLESQERKAFWAEHPASKVYVFSERPSFTGGGTDSAAYGFFVWQRGWTRPTELEVVSWR